MPELPSDFPALPRPALDLAPDRDAVADFFDYADLLTDDETATLRRLRSYLGEDVAPLVENAWERAEFPMQLVKGFADLDLAGLPYGLGEGRTEPARRLFLGFLHAEIARVDPSVNSFFGVHTGLAMGSVARRRHGGAAAALAARRWRGWRRSARSGSPSRTAGSDVAGGMRDHRAPRRRRVGARRRQALDRQRDVRRHHRRLGARPRDERGARVRRPRATPRA